MDEDERFSHIKNDPRFRSIPKREKKIQIDKRFTSMFNNKKFQLNYFMDKRGRPVQQSMSEDLRKYYEVESEPSDDENQIPSEHCRRKSKKTTKTLKTKGKKCQKQEDFDSGRESSAGEGDDSFQHKPLSAKKKKKIKKKMGEKVKLLVPKENSSDDDEGEVDEEEIDDENGIKKEEEEEVSNSEEEGEVSDEESGPDLARGEGDVESSSSDESTDGDDEEKEESGFDHQWGETDKSVTRSEDVSRRLAICNMDWDRIKAEDLYVLFHNFKPPQGIIHSVKIYPSEYGIERMKEEELHGPKELTRAVLGSDHEDETETRDGSKYHMETLRQYQLNRLRYYYAVVECDSAETANTLYTELDGKEYESSASQLDLRFIPDDTVFEHEPKSVADKLPDMSAYAPVLFTTKALQQTMVELTWDENNPNRLRTLEKAFQNDGDNLDDNLRTYLASSSSSSEDETQESHENGQVEDEVVQKKSKNQAVDRISKYKELLASIEEDENKKKQKDIEMEITWEPGLKDRTENLIKMRQQKQEMTYFEKYLEKKKEAKKQRRKDKKETEVARTESSDDLCADDDVPSDIDLNDSFFQEELSSFKGKKPLKKKKIRNSGKPEVEQDPNSKAELELLLMDEEADGRNHFNLKNIMEDETLSKRKRKKLEKTQNKEKKLKTEDNFKINAEDPRFSALFQSADFNIDPSDTHFKKTKAMETLMLEKQRRRAEKASNVSSQPKSDESHKMKMDPSLSYLVKSVKNKAQNFKRRK